MTVSTLEQRKYAKGLAVREKAVLASSNLFAARGFGGCSVADLAAEAAISRNQLFHHFASKENLALACVQRARLSFENEILTPATIHPNPINRLVYILDTLIKLQSEGWPFVRLLATFAAGEEELPPEVRLAVQEALENLFNGLRALMKEVKKSGRLPGGIKARVAAAQLLTTILGAAAVAGFGDTFLGTEVLVHLRDQASANGGAMVL